MELGRELGELEAANELLGRMHLHLGQAETASELLGESIPLARELSALPELAHLLRLSAHARNLRRDSAEALGHAQQAAASLAAALGDRLAQREIDLLLGRLRDQGSRA